MVCCIWQEYKKTIDQIKSVQPHVNLVQKMLKRDASTVPALGSRIPYIYVMGSKRDKSSDKVEHPLYVLEHKLPIDHRHYLEHQLSQPLLRLFEAILPDPRKTLFTGPHMQSKKLLTPTTGGITAFIQKVPTCLGCKAVLKKDDGTNTAVCGTCRSDGVGQQLYLEAMRKLKEKEASYGKLWSACDRCQKAMASKCNNNECPLYYRRAKIKMEVAEAQQTLGRFDCSW